MDKLEVVINKPIYIGMCVLDISKTVLYEFHYEFAKSRLGSNCKLLYTDTDSLIYDIKCPDVFEVMNENISRFDTSDYAADNPYQLPLVNKKIPGLMKDECNGKIVTEFIGLRSKMYCVQVDHEDYAKKNRGIKTNITKRIINSRHCRDCLFNNNLIYREQCTINSEFHKMYTAKFNKLASSPNDDNQKIFDKR